MRCWPTTSAPCRIRVSSSTVPRQSMAHLPHPHPSSRVRRCCGGGRDHGHAAVARSPNWRNTLPGQQASGPALRHVPLSRPLLDACSRDILPAIVIRGTDDLFRSSVPTTHAEMQPASHRLRRRSQSAKIRFEIESSGKCRGRHLADLFRRQWVITVGLGRVLGRVPHLSSNDLIGKLCRKLRLAESGQFCGRRGEAPPHEVSIFHPAPASSSPDPREIRARRRASRAGTFPRGIRRGVRPKRSTNPVGM